MNLYIITGTDPDDITYDLSLAVIANSVEDAESHWRTYYDREDVERPERVFHLMPGTRFAYPEGPIAWDGEFLPQVGGTEN